MNSRISSSEAGPALGQESHRGHDLPRRAEAALEAVVLHERLLHRVRSVGPGDPLDGGDGAALGLRRQGQAGQHSPAVHMDRARATGSLVTALLRAHQAQPVAQGVQQGDPGVQAERVGTAVHVECHDPFDDRGTFVHVPPARHVRHRVLLRTGRERLEPLLGPDPVS